MRVVVTLPGECRLIFWVEESRPSSSSSGQLPLSRTASWVTTCRAQQHGLAAAGGGPGWSSRSLAWKSSKGRNPAGGRRVSPTLTALTILVFLRLHAVTGIAQKCILPQHKEHHEFNMAIEPQHFVVRFPGSSFWVVPSNLKNGPGITDSGHFCTLLVIIHPSAVPEHWAVFLIILLLLIGSIAFDEHHSQIHPCVGNQRKWVSLESAGEDFHHPCVGNQREWFLGNLCGNLLVGKISTIHFAWIILAVGGGCGGGSATRE